jgi:cysteinyl-tRNA synthetase
MKWPSPWGVGYPGWHIECSTMAMCLHGQPTIDMHTGAEDNIFPHHECEIAQSTGATGRPFARYWLHARFLLVEGEKMSKSKGNFYTLRDLLAKGADPAAVRYALITAPYQRNANFTFKGLADADRQVRRLRSFIAAHPDVPAASSPQMGDTAVERAFAEALADDLNISAALGELSTWLHSTSNPTVEDVATLKRIDQVLGVLEPRAAGVAVEPTGLADDQIQAMCRQIDEARAAKDYAESDRLRDELAEAGIEVQTTRDGTTWRRKMQLNG